MFEKNVDERVKALERELFMVQEALYAFRGLYNSSTYVAANEFEVMSGHFLERHEKTMPLNGCQE